MGEANSSLARALIGISVALGILLLGPYVIGLLSSFSPSTVIEEPRRSQPPSRSVRNPRRSSDDSLDSDLGSDDILYSNE